MTNDDKRVLAEWLGLSTATYKGADNYVELVNFDENGVSSGGEFKPESPAVVLACLEKLVEDTMKVEFGQNRFQRASQYKAPKYWFMTHRAKDYEGDTAAECILAAALQCAKEKV